MLNQTILWRRKLFFTFFITITFVLEFALSSIPNVQVTTLLIMILAQKLGNKKRLEYTLYIFLYIMLQGITWGFNFYLISMFVGWIMWGWISMSITHWKIQYQSFVGFIFAFLYGLTFYPLTFLIYLTPFIPYVIADFPFALTMGVSNALTIIWLRDVLYARIPL
jgi:energy-coupling factor transport system substrate-specific component